jgi:Ca2+-transporting ATPase
MRTLRELSVPLETGLAPEAVAASRQRYGANRLTPLPREPLWRKFLEKFDEPIIKILLAAALLSMVVDLFKASVPLGGTALGLVVVVLGAGFLLKLGEWVPTLMFVCALVLAGLGLGTRHIPYEGLAVMVAVILATGVAFASEYKSDREFEVLNAHKDSLRAKVLRGGAFNTVSLEEVVVGDLVVLETGDEVPADGRVARATELYIDQSLMTGESEAVRKRAAGPDDDADGPDQAGCLYRGTQVVDGVGQMVVTEVGDATMLGQIARRLSADDGDEAGAADSGAGRVQKKLTINKELTPLQLKLTNLADLISKVGYIAAVAIFVAMFVRGLFVGEVKVPSDMATAVEVARNLLGYFVYMVIVIVVAVPEGLPMSVTVSLALAMQKMTRANSLVRQLVACETVGSATVICSDKTGTLTQNKMRVERLAVGGRVVERGSPEWGTPPLGRFAAAASPVPWVALNAAVNSTANLEEKEGKTVTVGNSTEGALLNWLREEKLEYTEYRLQFKPLYQVHFSSERKRMTTVVRHDGALVVLVKGATEALLEQTEHYLAADGSARPWTPEARAAVAAQVSDAAAGAMRTLAFGHVVLPAGTPDGEEALHALRERLEHGLVFDGFVAIRDPLREDVREAVGRCRAAGIEVKMITGDNVHTARAIAAEIGLLDRPDALVLTSPEFNALSDEEVKERLPRLRVLARARPLDKFRMVKLLQEQDHVVAVTGDGTNDAPALKKADVGLAMGIAGTEVAKEASKIVLLDDSFATIIKAVHWGRSLYENIQRFIQFQLTINVSALTIAFLGPFLGIKPPFTVLQLLWINVIMDTFASIALCSEPPRSGLMRLPPKRKDENIVTRPMRITIFTTAAFFVVVMIALLLGMKHGAWFAGPEAPPDDFEFKPLNVRQVTIFFTVYVLFQVWNEINCRSLTPEVSALDGLNRNLTFLTIAGIIVVGQVVIVTVGGAVFQVEPLGLVDWLVIAATTSSVLVFAEIARRVRLAAKR